MTSTENLTSSNVQVGDFQCWQAGTSAPIHRSEIIAADEATITIRIEVARRLSTQARQYRNQTYKRSSKLARPYNYPASGMRRWYERPA